MLTLTADSINQLFTGSCEAVLREGRPVAPRGLPTKEVLGAWLCLTRPRHRLLDVPPARVINPAFAAAEMVWIISGSDEAWIFDFNRQLLAYTDAGRLQGAYGPRLRRWSGTVDQLRQVVETLDTDPNSRQAVVQLFDPARDRQNDPSSSAPRTRETHTPRLPCPQFSSRLLALQARSLSIANDFHAETSGELDNRGAHACK